MKKKNMIPHYIDVPSYMNNKQRAKLVKQQLAKQAEANYINKMMNNRLSMLGW